MVRRYIRRARSVLGQQSATRAVIAISGATILAQAIAVGAAPLLTRLYTPQAFGAFFVLNSVSLALAAGLALRFELAIPLPQRDEVAKDLIFLSCAAALLLAIPVTAVLLAYSQTIASWLTLSGSPWLLLAVGPLAVSCCLFSVFNAVAVRERRYGAIARRQLVVALLTASLQLVVGAVYGSVIGLVLATLVAQILGALSLAIGSPLVATQLLRSRTQLLQTLRRYRHFPYLLAPAGWLNSFGANAPVVVIGALYASDAAGWFGLMLRVVSLPAAFVGTAFARVYVSELAQRRREATGTESALFWKVSGALGAVGLLMALILLVAAPWTFERVFGSEWSLSGNMARAYAFAAFGQIVASPISETLIVYERPRLQLAWDACRLFLTVGSLILASGFGCSLVAAVWILSTVTALTYLVNWEMCRRTVASHRVDMGIVHQLD